MLSLKRPLADWQGFQDERMIAPQPAYREPEQMNGRQRAHHTTSGPQVSSILLRLPFFTRRRQRPCSKLFSVAHPCRLRHRDTRKLAFKSRAYQPSLTSAYDPTQHTPVLFLRPRRENSLQRDDERHHQVQRHVVMRKTSTRYGERLQSHGSIWRCVDILLGVI